MQKLGSILILLTMFGTALAGCLGGEETSTETDDTGDDTGGDTGGTTNETTNETNGGGNDTTVTLTPLTVEEVFLVFMASGEGGEMPDPTEGLATFGMRITIKGPMVLLPSVGPMDTTITVTEMVDAESQRVMNGMLISTYYGMLNIESTEIQGLASDGSGNGIVNIRATEFNEMTGAPGQIINYYAVDHDWDFESVVADILDDGAEVVCPFDPDADDSPCSSPLCTDWSDPSEGCMYSAATYCADPDTDDLACGDDEETSETTMVCTSPYVMAWDSDGDGYYYCAEPDPDENGNCPLPTEPIVEDDGSNQCQTPDDDAPNCPEPSIHIVEDGGVDTCQPPLPEYLDEFEEEEGDIMELNFGFGEPDMAALATANWTTTFDENVGLQTFTGDVDMGEVFGMTTITMTLVPSDPPMLVSIDMDNGTTSQTIEILTGDAVSIDLVENETAGWINGSSDMVLNQATIWGAGDDDYTLNIGGVATGAIEVPTTQLELRILTPDEYDAENNVTILGELLAEWNLTSLETGVNWTDESDDAVWAIVWIDVDGDGLVSEGDMFDMHTSDEANGTFEVVLYDTWAGDYAGSMSIPDFTAGL